MGPTAVDSGTGGSTPSATLAWLGPTPANEGIETDADIPRIRRAIDAQRLRPDSVAYSTRVRKRFTARFIGFVLLIAGVLTPVGQATAAITCTSTAAPATTAYLPNITRTFGGVGGWDTPIFVQNAGAVEAQVDIAFFRFSDGSPVTCHTTKALAPGTSLLDDPNLAPDLPNDAQFSVVVKSYGAPVVATVNQLQGFGSTQQALSYSGFTAGATTVYMPNVTRKFLGYDVPLIVQNLGTFEAVVFAKFVSFDGTFTMEVNRVIAPGRSKVIDPDSDDPLIGAPGLKDGTQYAVTLTANQPIGVVANAYTKSGAAVAFSHNGLSSGATSLYAPYAVKTTDLHSPVVVQNLGTAPVVPTLAFTPLAGGAAQTFTLPPVPVGGARAFDPRFTVGTTAVCLIAAPAACLGLGEFSVKITAPTPIAAVVLPNSTTTAAGYLAAPNPNARVLLPAVMKNGGGPGGWNGTTYVQSTTATQATARWFNVATGDIAATQQLVLVPGQTLKIDPRTVPGLPDQSTFAVTIDANGPIAAVVFQQAATGGDASMIYEGFPQPTLPFTGVPASVRMTPSTATLAGGATQLFAITLRDQFGAPMIGPFGTAVVSPPTLGTATVGQGTVAFTAGTAGGTGTLTLSFGALTAVATITVVVPTTTVVGGITFQTSTSGPADVYVEAVISPTDRTTITNQVSSDVTVIQSDFAHTYLVRPRVYVFATTTSYTTGLQTILFLPPSEAQFLGQGTFGLFQPLTLGIAANWQKVTSELPVTTLRHELTHLMEDQLLAGGIAPAWFDEGNARLEENTVAGAQWKKMIGIYSAASMAALNALFTFPELTSQATWNSRSGTTPGIVQYHEASQAVQFLKNDLGMPSLLRIFSFIGAGQSFETAYAAASGQPFSVFAAAFPTRVRALAPAYPAITTASTTPRGGGLSFYLYGFPANSSATIIVSGTASSSPQTVTVSQYGTYFSFLGDAWPNGQYAIQANWSGGIVTTQAVKTSTFPSPSASLDPGVLIFELTPEADALPAN